MIDCFYLFLKYRNLNKLPLRYIESDSKLKQVWLLREYIALFGSNLSGWKLQQKTTILFIVNLDNWCGVYFTVICHLLAKW